VDFPIRKNKKSPVTGCAELFGNTRRCPKATAKNLSSHNADKFTVFGAFFLEQDFTVSRRKQGVVFAQTDVVASMEMGAALADNDISGNDVFTAVFFNA
jgi:hypothetical protein